MIRILITEDSAVVALLLKAIFEHEADFEVVGHARNGREAVELAAQLQPDLITMDIRMPVMDGFEATREIMSTRPVPIVVVSSSVDDEELRITFRAVEEGALAVIEKPRGFTHPDFEQIRRELVTTVRAMAEVKLVRRRRWAAPAPEPVRGVPEPVTDGRRCDLIAIGSSTGGPQALRVLLAGLPRDLRVPLAVVQHIGRGFIHGLVDWLNSYSGPHCRVAQHGEELLPGQVYFAPDDRHLQVQRIGPSVVAVLKDAPPVDNIRPSATPLFRSVAACCGGRAAGVVLTGMGADGAEGLLEMRRAGCATLVQDEESSVVYGMPAAACALGAAERVLPLERIAPHLCRLAGAPGAAA